MAVGELHIPEVFPVAGVKLATVEAGVRYQGRKDLVLIECGEQSNVAGVFTLNAFCAAPVQVAKKHLSSIKASQKKYLWINTGNANAGTGQRGLDDALAICSKLAALARVPLENVLPFSTGVIGENLPVDVINKGIEQAFSSKSDDWQAAAQGIMTTDTRIKLASKKAVIAGKAVVVTGIAKGAGMIKPNMATMLAYIATDAAVPQAMLQKLSKKLADISFNRISIDGDTSTNDSAMLIASGEGELEVESLSGQDFLEFENLLAEVYIELAQGLVRDGEGASKFVTVQVEQGGTDEECLAVAYTIAESPLVKTALFASDPNWGRLLAAIGRAGLQQLDVEHVSVYLDDVLIAENGCRAESYTEAAGQKVMNQQEITIRVLLDRGEANQTVWTTDLSHDYVTINAEYRT